MNFVKFLRTPFSQAPVSQNMNVYIWERPSTVVSQKVVLKMFGKYPGVYLHRIASYKLKIGWTHITIKIRCRKTSKISSQLYFSDFFKLTNMPGQGLFLRDLIPLRSCEKRGCEKILNSKISFWLFSTIQNYSTTIGDSRFFKIIISFALFWGLKEIREGNLV